MNTRLPHNDINLGIGNELYPSNWEECGKLCNASPLCKFWTYYVPTGRCWLKVANSGATIEKGIISGNKNCPLPTGAGIKFHILIRSQNSISCCCFDVNQLIYSGFLSVLHVLNL